MARRPTTLALLLCTLFTAARSAPGLAAPPSGRGEPTRTILRFSNYRVLFDRVQQGYPTCGASFLYRKGTLELIFLRPTEDGRGQETFLTRSDDLGKTWSDPVSFGPPVGNPKKLYQNASLVGVTASGTSLVTGSFTPRIPGRGYGSTWIDPPDPKLYGMHFARSFDLDKTWVTERIVQQNADGSDFAHYYNVVNGQFVLLREDRWMFGFGNCDD